jgi:hypothetical protein
LGGQTFQEKGLHGNRTRVFHGPIPSGGVGVLFISCLLLGPWTPFAASYRG